MHSSEPGSLTPHHSSRSHGFLSPNSEGANDFVMSASRMRLTRMRALRIARRASLVACLVAVALAAMTLASWTLQFSFLRSWWLDGLEMSHQTALAFLLGAGALAFLAAPDVSTHIRMGYVWCVVGMATICVLTLAGIGPDRMLPLTSFCLLLLAIAVWLVGRRLLKASTKPRNTHQEKTSPEIIASQVLLCVVMLLALMSFYGAALGVSLMPTTPSLMLMPLPSTVALFALSVGVLCLLPDCGLMRVITDGGVAGIMMRRLLPAAILIPLLLGWLRLLGENEGYYDTPSGVVLMTVGCVAVFSLSIWHNARLISRLDERRRAAERALQRARDNLEDEVRSRTTELTQINENLLQAVEERKQAQALSTQFSAILDTLVRSAAIGFTFIDRDFRYVAINDSLARMNGLPVEAHIGRLLREVFPDLASSVEPILRRVMESDEPIIDLEVQGNTSGTSGDIQYWLASYYPVRRMDGEVLGVGVFTQDISARKRAEAERDQLLQRERETRQQAEAARIEAEVANRTKDEFLATLSHELRTPLNAILGWASLLRTGGVDEATTQKALETIERNARAQTQIIEDILDVSRIVTGKLRLELAPLQLWPVVESALEAMRPTVGAKNIALYLHPTDEVFTVSGDATRLQQVLWNLLSNAVKFTPSGGRIDVYLRRAGDNAEIELRDSGQGIEPEFLPFVFERFRQADASSTRRHGGLGLGLALVRHIVELHGGTISAESDGAGQGSTFRVNLPAVWKSQTDDLQSTSSRLQPEYSINGQSGDEGRNTDSSQSFQFESRADDKELTSESRPLHGLSILLVEDQPDTREMLLHALESYGAKVCAAANADEARQECRALSPDIIVSDIEMPDENGYELLRSLRRQENYTSVPAIALSAHAREEDRANAREAGFNTHIAKPFQMTNLVQEILRLATRSQQNSF